MILGALHGIPKEELLLEAYSPVPGLWGEAPLSPRIQEIAVGSFKAKEPPLIRGGGYVVECLEAALWAFYKSEDYRSGALLAVNLGDDADTTGAVYGQLAGAYYREGGIPKNWREKVAMRDMILDLADRLYAYANVKTAHVE